MATLYAAKFDRYLGAGLQTVMLESDAVQIVNVVKVTERHWSQLVKDTRRVLNTMQNWQICHAWLEVNSAAHGLDKETVKQAKNKVWLEEIDNCICNNVLLEQQVLSLE